MLTLVTGKTNQSVKTLQHAAEEFKKDAPNLIILKENPVALDMLHFLINYDKNVMIITPHYVFKNNIEDKAVLCLSTKDLNVNNKIDFKVLLAKDKVDTVEKLFASVKALTGILTIQNNSNGSSPFDETKVGTLPAEVIKIITCEKKLEKVQPTKTPEELVDKLLGLMDEIKTDINALKEQTTTTSYATIRYDLESIICILDTLEDRSKFMRRTDDKIERLIGARKHRDLNTSRDDDRRTNDYLEQRGRLNHDSRRGSRD